MMDAMAKLQESSALHARHLQELATIGLEIRARLARKAG
jgi:hypothetical protein